MPVKTWALNAEARRVFTLESSAPVLTTAELYGSKLVAALDRQHPLDIFDVRGPYESSGLTADVVECFVCYLAGHNRPVHEVLFSRDQDMSTAFGNEFQGMTQGPISLAELQNVRARLRRDLTVNDCQPADGFGRPGHRRSRLAIDEMPASSGVAGCSVETPQPRPTEKVQSQKVRTASRGIARPVRRQDIVISANPRLTVAGHFCYNLLQKCRQTVQVGAARNSS